MLGLFRVTCRPDASYLKGVRQFFLGKEHLYEEFVIFYYNISKGTKAKTRVNGGNCLCCLREASGL